MEKYVISIDVGIVNLGICIFLVNDIEIKKIHEWKVISLVEDKKICSSFLKSGKACKSVAKYSNSYGCFCNRHVIDSTAKHIKPTVSKNIDLVSLGINLKNALDSLCVDISGNIENVLIENQISPIANRMKTIQGMIMQYFIMIKVQNIEFISAVNKLKIAGTEEIGGDKKTYKNRKELGIKITEHLINEKQCLRSDMFIGSKKDDLADALLQGVYFLTTKKKIKMY
jgi:hypothetical protein